MSEHDFATLEAAAYAGQLEQVKDALGIELTVEAVQQIEALTRRGYESFPIARALSIMTRALRAESGICAERSENRLFEHWLAVVWKNADGAERITLGIQMTAQARSMGNAWPALRGWKPRVELNRELAHAWARDTTQPNRFEFAVVARPRLGRSDTVNEDGLLAAIAAAPDDDGPRLVYADWLSERGDDRGEFIRRHIATKGFDQKLWGLLDSSWRGYAGELAPFTEARAFERGFPMRAHLTTAAFVKHGERFFSRWPLTRLDLDQPRFTPKQLAQLAAAPAMPLVRELCVSQAIFANNRRGLALASLAGGPPDGFRSLQTLRLIGCGWRGDDWRSLFSRFVAPKLENVVLETNHTHPSLFHGLAENESIPLRTLIESRRSMLGNPSAKEWRSAMTALSRRPGLERLSLRFCAHLDDAALGVFFDRGSEVQLREFSLASSSATDALLIKIARSPGAARLKEVRLFGGSFTLAGVRALVELPLEKLCLVGREWGDSAEVLRTLEALPASHPLRVVDLPDDDLLESHPRFRSDPDSWVPFEQPHRYRS